MEGKACNFFIIIDHIVEQAVANDAPTKHVGFLKEHSVAKKRIMGAMAMMSKILPYLESETTLRVAGSGGLPQGASTRGQDVFKWCMV